MVGLVIKKYKFKIEERRRGERRGEGGEREGRRRGEGGGESTLPCIAGSFRVIIFTINLTTS